MEEPIFRKLEKIAKVRPLSEEEQLAYNKSLKIYRDNYAIMKTERNEGYEEGIAEGIGIGEAKGREEGRAEGKAEGRAEVLFEVALSMLKAKANVEYIHEITGLPIEEIKKLKLD